MQDFTTKGSFTAMEPQHLINAALAIAGFLGGFWMKVMWDSLRELRQADESLTNKVQAIEVLVAGMYVKRDDMEKLTTALFSKLDRIEAKVDTKVGKDDCKACNA